MLRGSIVLWVALLLGLALGQDTRVVNILDPSTSYNREVGRLLVWVMAFAVLIFGVVTGALTYTVVKFRKRGNEQGEPPQFHGNDRLEILWTIIPTLIIVIIFGLTAQSMIANAKLPAGAMTVKVTGYQFWWDYEYEGLGIRNSNELILPVGKPVIVEITSKDIIHSWWPASLVGKQDAIPGVTTRLHFTPEKEGIYYGQCAELCGASHANMRFRVIVVSQEAFDRFVRGAQNYRAPEPQDALTRQGQGLFQQNCAACHAVKGTAAQGVIGPDLSYFGNRTTVGSGLWENTDTYLIPWIKNSPGVKPGSKMPPFAQLSDDDAKAIAAYIKSLRIEGLDFQGLPQF
ncbi:cytochrome c oxidase subunit II [Calidithermus roseus]|uniref:Cytochrome c oxidase subunit 2 n=1 Tax=Calidithermus roseus TaxID=1644118 RepID=A0A399F5M1_9DEIN|nr:cytochrome c oxidase subunit II [Calidithermus roseus]RIH89911.1 cytochrome c oxidase subunit 2 [Calidithermus roseus]